MLNREIWSAVWTFATGQHILSVNPNVVTYSFTQIKGKHTNFHNMTTFHFFFRFFLRNRKSIHIIPVWFVMFFSSLAEALSHEHHEFLFAFVYLFQVVYELCELDVSVVRHEESLSGFAEELDELAVVPRADVREPRVRRVDVGPDRGVQELS